jgi:hypothetical protein
MSLLRAIMETIMPPPPPPSTDLSPASPSPSSSVSPSSSLSPPEKAREQIRQHDAEMRIIEEMVAGLRGAPRSPGRGHREHTHPF